MRSVYFDDSKIMSWVLGINDRNTQYLEILLSNEIYVKGNCISADGPDYFEEFISKLIKTAKERKEELSESEIFMEYQLFNSEFEVNKPFSKKECSIIVNNKSVYPKSSKQAEFIDALNTNQINFAVGPAGTGKTFLAIAHALSQLLSGKKQKLVLTRPVVEAGESLGFLPGDLSQKLNPYLKPLYDSMEYLLTPSQIKKLEENGAIEISPLAYMRGRSINKAVIILDEAQNTTKSQMKMFLTRLGESSQAIITGDITQIDLPKNTASGLVHALSILNDIEGLKITEFSKNDIIRSRIVKEIISCYDREGKWD